MSEIISIRKINGALCEALDISPRMTQKVTIEFSASAPKATIVYLLDNAKANALANVLKEYDLVEK